MTRDLEEKEKMEAFRQTPQAYQMTARLLFPLLLACSLLAESQAEERRAPNVLMICIDDLNDWTGFLGGHPDVRTPHM